MTDALSIGIDAANIRVGGGLTHLVEMLRASNPQAFGINRVVVWGSSRTLAKLPEAPGWLVKRRVSALDGSLPRRIMWQLLGLDREAKREGCDLLLIPGGVQFGRFKPVVTISQNLLPFEWVELRRFGFSLMTLKMLLLRLLQAATFRRSVGLIFLTNYAKITVQRAVGHAERVKVIPLGVNSAFFADLHQAPAPFQNRHRDAEIKLLYVSVIDVYKHQWNVVIATMLLRNRGHNVTLRLIGAPTGRAARRLERALAKADPHRSFIKVEGWLPYEQLPEQYKSADIKIFASSCENLPNILIEAMASKLPIACSNRGPMPEVLGTAGEYFDPESPASIADAVERLICSPELRNAYAQQAQCVAANYSWQKCADATFQFLSDIGIQEKSKNL